MGNVGATGNLHRFGLSGRVPLESGIGVGAMASHSRRQSSHRGSGEWDRAWDAAKSLYCPTRTQVASPPAGMGGRDQIVSLSNHTLP